MDSTDFIARIADICERAARGDLEARISPSPADPEFARLARADALRKELAAAGWSMLDRKDGYSLEPAKK